MEFCNDCDNKLYLHEEENSLYLVCRRCGFKKKNTNTVIFTKNYKKISKINDNIKNNYIVFDNTLPRTTLKECPNIKCNSYNNPDKREVIYVPDSTTRVLNYICVNCFTEWKYT